MTQVNTTEVLPPYNGEAPQFITPSRNLKQFKRRGVHLHTYYSQKNKQHIWCESGLEHGFGLLLEYWKHVRSYQAQPTTFTIFVDGQKSRYTPDFVSYPNYGAPCFWEVKPNGWKQDSTMRARLDAAQKAANLSGYHFEVVTDEVIQEDPLAQNLRMIYPRIRPANQLQRQQLLSSLHAKGGRCSIAELLGLKSSPSWSAIAEHLFYHSTALEFAPFDTDMLLEARS